MNNMLSIALLFSYSFSTLSAAGSFYPIHLVDEKKLTIELSNNPFKCNVLDNRGWGLIHYAAQNDTTEAIFNIAKHTSSYLNIKTTEGLTPLDIAYMNNSMNAFIALWKVGANLNYAQYSDEIKEYLVERINTPDPRGCYLIHCAVRWDISSLKRVIALQLNINIQNFDGSNALYHCAINHTLSEQLSLLLAHNADPNIQISNSTYPLHAAINNYCSKNAMVLITHSKTNLNLKDFNGNTALHLAVLTNQFSLITFLLKHGASSTMVNKAGLTPLNIAKQKNI
ncbi:hypothetical protein COB28_02750 [Candidatus Dependentiae bacterium]|nr:MAG: hypothetical protein COB28_02750 [Candidatus Dependentiae bacterium]